jgi:hypothetical protein
MLQTNKKMILIHINALVEKFDSGYNVNWTEIQKSLAQIVQVFSS